MKQIAVTVQTAATKPKTATNKSTSPKAYMPSEPSLGVNAWFTTTANVAIDPAATYPARTSANFASGFINSLRAFLYTICWTKQRVRIHAVPSSFQCTVECPLRVRKRPFDARVKHP